MDPPGFGDGKHQNKRGGYRKGDLHASRLRLIQQYATFEALNQSKLSELHFALFVERAKKPVRYDNPRHVLRDLGRFST